jgi:hypothetical protein
MIFVSSKLISYLLDYPPDILFWEFCVSYLDALPKKTNLSMFTTDGSEKLPEPKLLSKFIVLARSNFKYSTEGEWMSA